MITNSNRNFLYVATVLCPTCVVSRITRRALLSVRFPKGKLSDQTVHCDCKLDRISVGLLGTYPRTMQQGQWCSLQDTSLSQSKGDGKVFLFQLSINSVCERMEKDGTLPILFLSPCTSVIITARAYVTILTSCYVIASRVYVTSIVS